MRVRWNLRIGGHIGVAALVLGLLAAGPAAAEGAIAQGFQTAETNAVAGALVSLKGGTPKTVELATADRADRIIGVVSSKPLVEISTGEEFEIQVVTSGLTQVLVSDINGDIKTGDKITASPIKGMGMKATRSMQVAGTAQSSLADVKTTTKTLTDTQGVTQEVKVGLIPIQVDVMFYAAAEDQATFLPQFLQDFANSLAGRAVSPVRVLVSTVLMILAVISIGVLLYSSVNSSIISIGRNPLSEGAVRKSLLEVGVTTLGILLLTVITIYLILTT